MADILVESKVDDLNVSPTFDAYSKVIIRTGQEDDDGNKVVYTAGDNTGYTLEVDNPWGTQQIAEDILTRIQGWAYKPYSADSAKLNPAFELGDSVVVDNVFSGVYQHNTEFKRELVLADIEAPSEEEIDHEYEYEDSKTRQYTRQLSNIEARLNFWADRIEAKVDVDGGSSTFGWSLTEDAWTVFNERGNIFTINENGAYIQGEVQAKEGKIGGFNIGERGLWSNLSQYDGGETVGVYIGTDGIRLGEKFKVDSSGNLTAQDGTFDGNVYAKNIKHGGNYGTFSGLGITPTTLGTSQFVTGVVNSLGFADFANDVFNNRDTAEYVNAKYLTLSKYATANDYYVRIDEETQGTVGKHTHNVKVENGKVTIGAPDFTGAPHPFEVTPTNLSISQNGGATYQSGLRRYAVPVKVTAADGTTLKTATLYVSATDAYDAGKDYGISWAKSKCIVDYYYTSSWGSDNYYIIYANIDGERAADVSVKVSNNGRITNR